MKFKNREKFTRKRVLIYGNDGTGKSSFAEYYCEQNNLKPVVIDIDDTNYTNLPILDLDLGNDIKTFNNVKEAILEITKSEYDTIILDGVTSLLEMLVSKAKGLAKYGDRATRFNELLKLLNQSKKHLIFIGQADMKVIYNEDHQSSKMVIKVNSIVNEKYYCYINEKGEYKQKIEKMRTISKNTKNEEKVIAETKTVEEPTLIFEDGATVKQQSENISKEGKKFFEEIESQNITDLELEVAGTYDPAFTILAIHRSDKPMEIKLEAYAHCLKKASMTTLYGASKLKMKYILFVIHKKLTFENKDFTVKSALNCLNEYYKEKILSKKDCQECALLLYKAKTNEDGIILKCGGLKYDTKTE